MVIVWKLRGNIIRTAPCWVVWHSVHSQQHIHVSSSYRSSRSGLSHWDPYAMRTGGCLESCIIVTWWSGAGGIQALSERPSSFLQCFNTVGLVIWPVKIVPDMTYNVFGGTLNFYTTTAMDKGHWLNFVSRLHLDADVGFFWRILQQCKIGHFSQFGLYL